MTSDWERPGITPPLVELRKGNEARETGRLWAKRVLEERNDCLSFLEALNKVLDLVTKNPHDSRILPSLRAFLEETTGYFQSVVLVFKNVIPHVRQGSGKSEKALAAEIQKQIILLSRNVHLLQAFPEVYHAAESIRRQLMSAAGDVGSIINGVYVIGSTDYVRQAGNVLSFFDKRYAQHQLIAGAFSAGSTMGDYPRILRLVTDLAYTTAQAESTPVPPGVPHPFCNFVKTGVPLLGNALAASTDDAGAAMAQYAATIPRGDVVWEQLFNYLFCSPLVAEYDETLKGLEQPGIAERLVYFRQYLAEELFLPAVVNGIEEDPGKLLARLGIGKNDATLDAFLSRIDAPFISTLVDALVESVQLAPSAWSVFHRAERLGAKQLISHVPLAAYGQQYFYDSKMITARRKPFVDEASYTVVRDFIEAICSDIKKRFKSPRTDLLIRELRKAFLRPYAETHSEKITKELVSYLGTIRESMGVDFVPYLQSMVADNREVSARLMNNILHKFERGYGLHNLLTNHIQFGEKTLPGILGFESVQFEPAQYDKDEILFVLKMRGMNLSISGHVQIGASLDLTPECSLSVTFPGELEGLGEILRQIVICSLSDLVSVSRPRKIKRVAQSANRAAGGGTTDVDSTRSLPRRRTSLGEAKLIELADKAAGHELKGATRIIHTVDPYVRSLPGSDRYARAYKAYCANVSADTTAALHDARRKIYRPSEGKLRIPPILRADLRVITDPITSEQVYLDTWVTDHFNPRPTAEEMRSLPKMFDRYYRHGPALRMLSAHVFMQFQRTAQAS